MEQLKKVIYVWLIRLFSLFSKPLTVKKRITYLMSFPKNNNGFLEELVNQNKETEIVIFFEKNCQNEALKFSGPTVRVIPLSSSIRFLRKAVPLLMQSQIILCDNYFPLLAGFFPHKKTTIIQIWHANGAIKRFGLEDPTAMKRSYFDQLRFKQVYKRFDEYIVGSEMMGKVFERSYGANKECIKTLGNPRTDIYFDKQVLQEKRKQFFRDFPKLKDRKILLYAPTYRNEEEEYPLDVRRLYESLGDEYGVLMKKHPHILKRPVQNEYKDFFYADLDDYKIEDLLVITDILITDYSSVPFDFTLLSNARNIFFYCYDLEKYKKETGLQADFEKWAPGKISESMEELIRQVTQNKRQDFSKFNQLWNTYNDGKSKERLLKHVQELLL